MLSVDWLSTRIQLLSIAFIISLVAWVTSCLRWKLKSCWLLPLFGESCHDACAMALWAKSCFSSSMLCKKSVTVEVFSALWLYSLLVIDDTMVCGVYHHHCLHNLLALISALGCNMSRFSTLVADDIATVVPLPWPTVVPMPIVFPFFGGDEC